MEGIEPRLGFRVREAPRSAHPTTEAVHVRPVRVLRPADEAMGFRGVGVLVVRRPTRERGAVIGKQTRPKCARCGKTTDRLAYFTGTPQWCCADCEYKHAHPDAATVKRERKRAQSETLWEGAE